MKRVFKIFFIALIALVTIGLVGQFLANAGIFEALTGIKDAITGLNGSTVAGTPNIAVTVDCDCGDHHHDDDCPEDTTGPAETTGDTKSCDHTYTVWYSESHHWKQCSICGDRGKEVAHTKPCTTCGYGVGATTTACDHSWGACCNNGWKCTKCSALNHTKCHNHTWANCCANGKYCTGCGYKNHTCATAAPAPDTTAPTPETTAPHTHSYSWKSNANQHWKQCSCGVTTGAAGHTFADGACTVCGRSCSHNWVTCCENGNKCATCGKLNHTKCHNHSYNVKCCENGKKCSCGVKNHSSCYTHTHSYNVKCCDNGYKCSCGVKNHSNCYTHTHSYNVKCCENGYKCSCGQKNHSSCYTHTHNYVVQYNTSYHWYVCACNMNAVYGKTAHTYNANGVCTGCGYAKPVVTPPVVTQQCTNCGDSAHTVNQCPYCTICRMHKDLGHASNCVYATNSNGSNGTASGDYCSHCQMATQFGHANNCPNNQQGSSSTGTNSSPAGSRYNDWP